MRSTMPALRVASPQALRNAFGAQAMPRLLVRTTVAVRALAVVEHGPQPARYRDIHAAAGLGLPQSYPLPVIGGPGQREQIALPLAGFERQHQRPLQGSGRHREERRKMGFLPNLFGAVGMVEALDALGRAIQCQSPRPRP